MWCLAKRFVDILIFILIHSLLFAFSVGGLGGVGGQWNTRSKYFGKIRILVLFQCWPFLFSSRGDCRLSDHLCCCFLAASIPAKVFSVLVFWHSPPLCAICMHVFCIIFICQTAFRTQLVFCILELLCWLSAWFLWLACAVRAYVYMTYWIQLSVFLVTVESSLDFLFVRFCLYPSIVLLQTVLSHKCCLAEKLRELCLFWAFAFFLCKINCHLL